MPKEIDLTPKTFPIIPAKEKIELPVSFDDIELSGIKTGNLIREVSNASKLKTAVKVADCVVAESGGDFTSIQDALNAGKKRIYVKRGTYEITSPIVISSDDVIIAGEDREGVIIKATTHVNMIEIQAGLAGIILRDFTLENTIKGETDDICILDIAGTSANWVSECLFENLILKNGEWHSVDAGYLQDSIFNKIYITSCDGYFGLFDSSRHNVVSSCKFSSSGGITIGGEYNLITGNYIYGACNQGVSIGAGYNLIIGNFFRMPYREAIRVDKGKGSIIMGNTVYDGWQEGIVLDRDVEHCLILNNSFYQCGQRANNTYDVISIVYGVGADPIQYNLIQGNVCRAGVATNKPRYAIGIDSYGKYNYIVNNDLYNDGFGSGVVNDGGVENIFRNNRGYNPVGLASITVGASPFTYTAGGSPETVYISGGTVSDISKGGTTIFTDTGHSIELEPHESIVITYSAAPTMIKDIH